jgi:Tfp pilus assembly protein PilF
VNVYPDLEAAIRRSLDKDVAKRFASMQQLADELRRIARVLELSDAMETQAMGPPSTEEIVTPSTPDPETRSKVRRRPLLIAGAVTAVALLLAGVVALNPDWRKRLVEVVVKPVPPENHTTVAILPFTGGADAEMSALAGGLSQRLGARLTRLETFRDSLTILPPADLLSRSIPDGEQAMRKLGATLVISGTLSRAAASWQLALDFRDRRRAQPEARIVENTDIGNLEDLAADAVAGELEVSADASAALLRTGTSLAAAYEPYLRGMGYLQRWDKAENLNEARAEFARAAKADPQFALAQAGLAETARIGYNVGKATSELLSARTYARKAVQLDPRLAEAHIVLGRIYQVFSGQRDLAVEEFKTALDLDPHNSDAIQGLAESYDQLGRDADAEAAFKRAVQLRHWSWSAHNKLASYYFHHHRYADAEAEYRAALKVAPDNAAVYGNLGMTLMDQDKTADAVDALKRSIELEPGYAALDNLASLYYRQRKFRDAAADYRKALDLNANDYRVWGSQAQALLHSGAPRGEAEICLHRAIALGEERLQVKSDDSEAMALLAVYEALLGDKASALSRVSQAANQGATEDVAMNCATACELIGDRAGAKRWAQQALDLGYRWKDLRDDVDLGSLASSLNLRHSP